MIEKHKEKTMNKAMKAVGGALAVLILSCGLAAKSHALPTQTLLSTASTVTDAYDTKPSTLTFQACDPVNGNYILASGKDMIVIWDSSAVSTGTYTVSSVALGHRTGDNTKTLNANQFALTYPLPLTGWQQPDGNLYFTCDNSYMKLAVIRVP